MCRVNRHTQIIPAHVTRHSAIGRKYEPLRRIPQELLHTIPDRSLIARRDHTVALQPTHKRTLEHLSRLTQRKLALSQLQAGIDDVTGVIQERAQIVVATVVVTDVENVEGTRRVDLPGAAPAKRCASPPCVEA